MKITTYDVLARENYRPCVQEKKLSLNVVVPLVMSFMAGTGGSVTVQSAEAIGRWLYTPTIHVGFSSQATATIEEADTRTPAEHVVRIRDEFSLNMSELADVLGVSRPTAYAWIKGNEPKQEAILEIQRLSAIAEKLNGLNIKRIDKLVRRPIFGSQSLLDKLKSRDKIDEALVVIEKLSIKESEARGKAKGSGKNRRGAVDAAQEYSTPAYSRG